MRLRAWICQSQECLWLSIFRSRFVPEAIRGTGVTAHGNVCSWNYSISDAKWHRANN